MDKESQAVIRILKFLVYIFLTYIGVVLEQHSPISRIKKHREFYNSFSSDIGDLLYFLLVKREQELEK